MNSQLFKEIVPYQILLQFLNENCHIEDGFHVFSKVNFRKANFHNRVKPLCESIVNYYHVSKRYYVNRTMDYCRFTTILRQLCRLHNLPYTSRMIYNKSTYDILYYITVNIDS